jgi:hypothetical protein
MPFVVSLSNHALCVESADQDNPALPRKAWFDRLTTNRVFDGLATDEVTESAIA